MVENVSNKQQEFLAGHTNTVSCLALSRSGRFIASGQVTDMGFKVNRLMPVNFEWCAYMNGSS